MRIRSLIYLLGLSALILGTLPASAQVQPPAGLAIDFTAEAKGADIIEYRIAVRNVSTNDLGPLQVMGGISAGVSMRTSWAGPDVTKNPGNFDGQWVTWHNNWIQSGASQGPFFYTVSAPSGLLLRTTARVQWQGPQPGTNSTSLVVSAGPVGAPGVAAPSGVLDFPIPNGQFYKQANGQGGAGNPGFAVVDAGVDGSGQTITMISAFRALGGVDRLGYPISRRFKSEPNDSFTYQAFQKAILQWDPGSRTARLTNLMDNLHDAGFDPVLEHKSYPAWQPDNSGGDLAKARAERLGWLQDPAYQDLADAYLRTTDYETLMGLPAAKPRTYGTTRVLRLQRAVLASYNNGPVVSASAGDDAKSVGYLTGEVLLPQDPGERDLVAWTYRTQAQVPQPAAQQRYKYFWEWVEVWPNCSHTFLYGTLRDGYNNPVAGELVKTWNDWGNEAGSIGGAWGPGGWMRDFGDGIRPGTWHIQVLNNTTMAPLSPVFDVRFTDKCGTDGVQEIILHLRAYAGY